MRLQSDESSSSRGRDEIDYSFEEMDEFIMEESILERHSEHSSRGTPFDENAMNLDDPEYVEEATESFDESTQTDDNDDDDDELDRVVKRGRGRPPKARAAKAKKSKKPEQSTRPTRTTRAASVRF